MKIVVVGGGRMGLPLACTFAERGASVTVCDIDPRLVARIEAGECPYNEPGLSDLMTSLHAKGRLRGTTETANAASTADVIVIIVPAHLTPNREIDLGALRKASIEVGRGLKPGALVVYETTVSVGGTRRYLVPLLEQHSGFSAGKDFYVAYSPERVKANLVLSRLEATPKVIGALDSASCDKALGFYKIFLGAPIDCVGSIEAAEMTKLMGMLYRDANIALANELAAFCEAVGVDFERARASANADGEANVLNPGIGVGGHCVPVYPYFLTREARRLGMVQRISEVAREINDEQPVRELERVAAAWKPVAGQKVHLLGLGFRPEVKVDTLSPTYALRGALQRRGAIVTIEDPYYCNEELRNAGFEPGTAENATFVILCTAHGAFAHPNFSAWRAAGVQVVLDGRNYWSQQEVESAGLVYFGIGRPSRAELEAGVYAGMTPGAIGKLQPIREAS